MEFKSELQADTWQIQYEIPWVIGCIVCAIAWQKTRIFADKRHKTQQTKRQ